MGGGACHQGNVISPISSHPSFIVGRGRRGRQTQKSVKPVSIRRGAAAARLRRRPQFGPIILHFSHHCIFSHVLSLFMVPFFLSPGRGRDKDRAEAFVVSRRRLDKVDETHLRTLSATTLSSLRTAETLTKKRSLPPPFLSVVRPCCLSFILPPQKKRTPEASRPIRPGGGRHK